MSEEARFWLLRGIPAAKAGQKQEARFYLQRALDLATDDRQRVDALFWLSEVVEDQSERVALLNEALLYEPSNLAVRQKLAVLRGELDPNEALHPDEIPPEPPRRRGQLHRFECPNCGGHMVYKPDKERLVCQYCGFTTSDKDLSAVGEVERDFLEALVTASGRQKPIPQPVVSCQACGGVFLVGNDAMSYQCPYCASNYALQEIDKRSLVPPSAILPMRLELSQAERVLKKWRAEENITRQRAVLEEPRGCYLPAWAFDVHGELRWTVWIEEDDERVSRQGSMLVLEDDMLVNAVTDLPGPIATGIEAFDISQFRPYELDFLAGFPARVYDLPPRQAALSVRERLFARARKQARLQLGLPDIEDFRCVFPKVTITRYYLVFLPAWISFLHLEGNRYFILINGSTGSVFTDYPRHSFWDRLIGQK